MWQRYKLYLLAFVIYTIATGALVVLELLAIRYGDATVLTRLVTTLSGSFLGGFALVLGILRDDRFEKERRRAEKAEAAIADWQQRAAETEKRAAETEKRAAAAEKRAEQAEQARREAEQRQEHAGAELQRLRDEQSRETAARLRRLEAAVGIAPMATADADDRNNRPME